MNTLDGTWLMIKGGSDYGIPVFIRIESGMINHFKINKGSEKENIELGFYYDEEISKTKNHTVNKDRIRFYRMGKKLRVLSDKETITTDHEFEIDYERIQPTNTILDKDEIQKLEFDVIWNGQSIDFSFNKILDEPIIQEMNKSLNKEGRKIILEKFENTFFGTIFDNGRREKLFPIREIDNEKIILMGFPTEPYTVIGKRKT